MWTALREDRPHRPAFAPAPAPARDVLWAEVTAGRIDGDAVDAVLATDGQRDRHHRLTRPGGLSDREVEVLRLIARGCSNRDVAGRCRSRRRRSATTSATSTPRSV